VGAHPRCDDAEHYLVGPRPWWHDEAACVGKPPEWWFPTRGSLDGIRRGRQVCATCPVQEPCLEWALEAAPDFGLWGNKSVRERQAIAKERRRREAQSSTAVAAAG
jgi:WhiB family redox-sensing transcriptional regulator